MDSQSTTSNLYFQWVINDWAYCKLVRAKLARRTRDTGLRFALLRTRVYCAKLETNRTRRPDLPAKCPPCPKILFKTPYALHCTYPKRKVLGPVPRKSRNILGAFQVVFRDFWEIGGCFSKDPVTYRARKAILETMIRLPWKAALLIRFRYKERQNKCQVSKLEPCSYWRYKGFMWPEKFRDVRETGPRPLHCS